MSPEETRDLFATDDDFNHENPEEWWYEDCDPTEPDHRCYCFCGCDAPVGFYGDKCGMCELCFEPSYESYPLWQRIRWWIEDAGRRAASRFKSLTQRQSTIPKDDDMLF